MALKLSVRKQFLAERKNAGNRVTIGFTGIADLRHFIGLEYIKGCGGLRHKFYKYGWRCKIFAF